MFTTNFSKTFFFVLFCQDWIYAYKVLSNSILLFDIFTTIKSFDISKNWFYLFSNSDQNIKEFVTVPIHSSDIRPYFILEWEKEKEMAKDGVKAKDLGME